MKYTTEQVVNGIIEYADHEVLKKLPTSGKWLLGTGIGLMTTRVNEVADELQDNALVKMLGVVDDDGHWDVEAVAESLESSADKYGKMQLQVPLVGKLTFSSEDVGVLKEYIEKEGEDDE